MRAIRKLKGMTAEALESYNDKLDGMARAQYIEKIQKEDGVTYDEAIRLCSEDPKYSLGWKLCSPAVMAMLKMKGGTEKFKSWLSPEELDLFEREVEPMNLKTLMKEERKRQRKRQQ